MDVDAADPGDIDALYLLVTEAIVRAEQLDDLDASEAAEAYLDVSRLEERIASLLPASSPEGALARRGAVRAAVAAGDFQRSAELVDRFSADPQAAEGLTDQLRALLRPSIETDEGRSETQSPQVGKETSIGGDTPVSRGPTMFLCHTSADTAIAQRFTAALGNLGFGIWSNASEIQPGERWKDRIRAGIRENGVLLVILSRQSVSSSWFRSEIAVARAWQLKGEEMAIIPVLVENLEIPETLRDLMYVDVRSDFETGFARVVEALEQLERRGSS